MQAWKYAISEDGEKALIELEIPNNAHRIMWTDRGRSSYAIVKSIRLYSPISREFTHDIRKALSAYDQKFVYEVGKQVYADSFDSDLINMGSHGIHFYVTRAIALAGLYGDDWYSYRVQAFNRKLEKTRAKEKTQFMKDLCNSLRESFGEADGSTS